MTQPILIPEGQELPPASEAATPHRVLGARSHGRRHARQSRRPGRRCRDHQLAHAHAPARRPRHRSPRRSRRLRRRCRDDDPQASAAARLSRECPGRSAQRRPSRPRKKPTAAAISARLPIVTIDGETARDFDDAVLVTDRADGGYELQVHIADVAEYVRAGTDLDLEARLRGTSVYFPDRAIPMLPAGALDRHLQPAPRRRPPRPQLHHAARRNRPHRELRDCRRRHPLRRAHDLHRGPRHS